MIDIRSADEGPSLGAARDLIRAHFLAHSDAHDPATIEAIVDALPTPYDATDGGLWVAWEGGEPHGCVAIHGIAPGTAELKRMYVKPSSRGRGIARVLSEFAIEAARDRGYTMIRLGTLSSMHAAHKLYESLGFKRIESYRPEEFGDTWFYELSLTHR